MDNGFSTVIMVILGLSLFLIFSTCFLSYAEKRDERCNNLCNSSRVISCIGNVEKNKLFLVVCADSELNIKAIADKN